jgi:hypothetical protein
MSGHKITWTYLALWTGAGPGDDEPACYLPSLDPGARGPLLYGNDSLGRRAAEAERKRCAEIDIDAKLVLVRVTIEPVETPHAQT